MRIIGQATINPVLFYSGKIIGYMLWVLFGLELLGLRVFGSTPDRTLHLLSYVCLGLGLVVIALSMATLGRSTRLGLPAEGTTLRTTGIYRFSRNPMYVGFFLTILAAVLYTPNVLTVAMGLYSIVVYHLIILGEEVFLQKRFGADYTTYCQNVRRYI